MAEAVREGNSSLYSFVRVLTACAFHTVLPVSYHHTDRIPAEPPFVLISNHVHALDPFLVAYPVRNHQAVFLGKKELAKNRLFRRVLTGLHTILVDRHNTDMSAMRECMKALKAGKPLVIFPEGTRHHEGQMEHIENGASLIIMRSRAPVVPMYIDRPLKLFRRVSVWVGDPIPYEDLLARGINAETCEEMNERMRETFRGLIRDAEAGVGKHPLRKK